MTTDPVRLLAKDEDAFATSLLRSAKDGDTEAARSHKAAVLGAAGGAAAIGSTVVATKLASRNLWTLAGTKWLAGAAFVLTAGAGVAFWWSPAAPPSHSPAASERPAPVAEPPAQAHEPAPSAEPLSAAADLPAHPSAEPKIPALPADPSPKTAVASAPKQPAAEPVTVATAEPAPAPAASGLSEEVAALRTAREALGRGDAQRCLEAVDGYFAKFPAGHLSAEARFLRVQALASAGRTAEARALARSLLAQNPKSPYAGKLRAIAGEDAAPANP